MQFLEIGTRGTELFLSTFGLYLSIDTRWVLLASVVVLFRKVFHWSKSW